MNGKRYICIGRRCDYTRVLPEDPTTAPGTVELKCENCGYPRTFYALGSADHAALVIGRWGSA